MRSISTQVTIIILFGFCLPLENFATENLAHEIGLNSGPTIQRSTSSNKIYFESELKLDFKQGGPYLAQNQGIQDMNSNPSLGGSGFLQGSFNFGGGLGGGGFGTGGVNSKPTSAPLYQLDQKDLDTIGKELGKLTDALAKDASIDERAASLAFDLRQERIPITNLLKALVADPDSLTQSQIEIAVTVILDEQYLNRAGPLASTALSDEIVANREKLNVIATKNYVSTSNDRSGIGSEADEQSSAIVDSIDQSLALVQFFDFDMLDVSELNLDYGLTPLTEEQKALDHFFKAGQQLRIASGVLKEDKIVEMSDGEILTLSEALARKTFFKKVQNEDEFWNFIDRSTVFHYIGGITGDLPFLTQVILNDRHTDLSFVVEELYRRSFIPVDEGLDMLLCRTKSRRKVVAQIQNATTDFANDLADGISDVEKSEQQPNQQSTHIPTQIAEQNISTPKGRRLSGSDSKQDESDVLPWKQSDRISGNELFNAVVEEFKSKGHSLSDLKALCQDPANSTSKGNSRLTLQNDVLLEAFVKMGKWDCLPELEDPILKNFERYIERKFSKHQRTDCSDRLSLRSKLSENISKIVDAHQIYENEIDALVDTLWRAKKKPECTEKGLESLKRKSISDLGERLPSKIESFIEPVNSINYVYRGNGTCGYVGFRFYDKTKTELQENDKQWKSILLPDYGTLNLEYSKRGKSPILKSTK